MSNSPAGLFRQREGSKFLRKKYEKIGERYPGIGSNNSTLDAELGNSAKDNSCLE